MTLLYDLAAMPWLPPAPPDFRARRRVLEDDPGSDPALELYRLAGHALDLNQLIHLGATLGKLRRNTGPLAGGALRLAVVGNANCDMILPALPGAALRHGIDLEVLGGDFGQVAQVALDPDSFIARQRPEAVLLALDHRGPPLTEGAGRALDWVAEMARGLRRAGAGLVIHQSLVPPPVPLFGSLDVIHAGAVRRIIEDYNAGLAGLTADGDLVLDVAGLAQAVGTTRWFHPAQWFIGKLPFAPDLIPLYADHVSRLLAALWGRSRKGLVLDLDNTLWGGVIGDDGVEGIVLGQGSGLGEAFLEIQRQVMALQERGVILAVCSKNDPQVALEPFRRHSEMLLTEERIACFVANWHDKASNLETIARRLDIGLDALVLLDDNPAERAQVRQALPRVAVPELPEDPSLYPWALAAAGYFETIRVTAEDRERTRQYRDNASRQALLETTRDLGAFLAGLEMVARVGPITLLTLKRAVQLINKTNQFNLTTRRHTESAVAALLADPRVTTFQVILKDRFGDNGLISVAICRPPAAGEEGIWEIDTWLMSCRVLKRRVEEALLRVMVETARQAGIAILRGSYLPSGRNGLVEEHYPALGFEPAGVEEGGITHWLLRVEAPLGPEPPIRIVREGT
ncbi:MAG: HAD family hydrolase [Magnetococcales bacterium]|nr:HAD family hydrolase [Magnetococcales bacterium]